MRKQNRLQLFLDAVVVAVVLFLDQFTKDLAIAHLKDKPALVLAEGVLELCYLENTGTAFSMFRDQKFLILAINFVVLGAIFFFLFRLPESRKCRLVHFLLAALSAGALGNIIDRIRFDYVVDFISFVLIDFPVFNVADCFIVVATILLFLVFLFVLKEEDLAFLKLSRQSERE